MPREDLKLDLDIIGTTGLRRAGGRVFEEFLTELQFEKGICVYKEMRDNEPIINAMLFVIEMMIRQTSWAITPVDESPEALEAKEFVDGILNDMEMTWEDTISEILSMLTFGFSTHEIIWKRRLGLQRDPTKCSRFNDGRIGWRKLPIRSQDTLLEWNFDENGDVLGFIQLDPYHGGRPQRDIPIEKMLLFRTTSHKENPQGRSVLRGSYRPYYFKRLIENLRGIGVERGLAGLPTAWVPARMLSKDASAQDKSAVQAIKDIVINIKRDEQEGLVLPLEYDENGNKLWDFTLMSSGSGAGQRMSGINDIIKEYNQTIAMTLLTDFILLGHEKVGSFALASSKTKLFATAIGAWMDNIAAVFNRVAFPRLFRLNAMNEELMPSLSHGDIETLSLGELGDYVQKLTQSGVPLFPDDRLENHLRREASFPLKSEDDEL